MRSFLNRVFHSPLFSGYFSIIIIFFLFVPVIYMIAWSFSSSENVISLTDPTIRWYKHIIRSREWTSSFFYSIAIGIVSSTLALFFSIVYLYYSYISSKLYRIYGLIITILPLVFPVLIYAIAYRFFGNLFQIPEAIKLILGHAILIYPLQFFILESSKDNINIHWILGSRSFGAKHFEVITKIVIPNMKSVLLTAFAFGFIFSFDEIVISNFLIDSELATIPKRIWNNTDRVVNPTPAIPYVLNILLLIIIYFSYKTVLRINLKNMDVYKALKRNKILQSLTIAILIGFLEAMLEIWLSIRNDSLDLVGSISRSLAATFLVFIVVSYFKVFKWSYIILPQIDEFRKEKHPSSKRSISIKFLSLFVKDVFVKVNAVLDGNIGKSLTIEEIDSISKTLFKESKGYYFGTDSNTPSEFNEYYPYYLMHSLDSKGSTRIILSDKSTLVDEFSNKPEIFKQFTQWHKSNNFLLLFVDKSKAEQKKIEFGLNATDIGIWDNDYVMVFQPELGTQVKRIKFWFFFKDANPDANSYIEYYNFLLRMCDPKELAVRNNILTFNQVNQESIIQITDQLNRLWKP